MIDKDTEERIETDVKFVPLLTAEQKRKLAEKTRKTEEKEAKK